MTTIIVKDTLRMSVEAATGGRVTVLYDDKGLPSYMCVIPKFNCKDIDPALGAGVHPAFIVGGVEKSEIFVGQYPAIVQEGRAISLPGVDPTCSINFDAARVACTAKGPGWHMMSNWEWAAIALWCLKNGFEPRGNTYHGRHHDQTHEQGRRQDGVTPGTASGTARTLNGSGPASWRHDNSFTGISDIVGNTYKWCDGMKLVGGKIYMPNDNDYAADEADWADQGVIIADDSDTTKLGTTEDTTETAGSTLFGTWGGLTTTINYDALDTAIQERMLQALIAPMAEDNPTGSLYFETDGEKVPMRGGDWSSSSIAGLGALTLCNPRSTAITALGFFSAFIA